MRVAPLSRPMTVEDTIWPSVRVGRRPRCARASSGSTRTAPAPTRARPSRRCTRAATTGCSSPRSIRRARGTSILSHMDCVASRLARLATTSRRTSFPNVEPTAGYKYLTRFDQRSASRWTWQLPGGALEQTMALVRGAERGGVALRLARRRCRRSCGSSAARAPPFPHAGARARLDDAERRAPARRGARAAGAGVAPRRASGTRRRSSDRPTGGAASSISPSRRGDSTSTRTSGRPGMFSAQLLPGHRGSLHRGRRSKRCPIASRPSLMREAEHALVPTHDPGPLHSRARRTLSAARHAFIADSAKEPAIIAGYPWFEVWGRDTAHLAPRASSRAPRGGRRARRAPHDGARTCRTASFPTASPTRARRPSFTRPTRRCGSSKRRGSSSSWSASPIRSCSGELFDALGQRLRSGAAGDPAQHPRHGRGALRRGRCRICAHVDGREGRRLGRSRRARGCRSSCRRSGRARATRSPTWRPRSGEAELAVRAKDAHAALLFAFRRRFWCESTGYPYDVVSEASGEAAWRDTAIRPNAVIALAVEPRLFDSHQAAVDPRRRRARSGDARWSSHARRPECTATRGRYGGGVKDRDSAYHQGTVWPFLLGFYVRAAMRHRPQRSAQLRERLEALVESAMPQCARARAGSRGRRRGAAPSAGRLRGAGLERGRALARARLGSCLTERVVSQTPGQRGQKGMPFRTRDVTQLGYRRIVLLLVALVIVPTGLLTAVGTLLLVLGEARVNLVMGILVLCFTGAVVTGSVLVWVFVRREANLSQLQSDFVSKVSHELRTPLTSIRMFTETLRLRRGDPELENRCVDALGKESVAPAEADRSAARVGEDGERSARASSSARPTPARSSRRPFSRSSRCASDEDVELEVRIEPDLPVILGRPRRARRRGRQSLVERLQIRRRAAAHRRSARRRATAACRISVKDNGGGIPRAEHKRIFQKFYRVDDRLARQKEGSGLGSRNRRAHREGPRRAGRARKRARTRVRRFRSFSRRQHPPALRRRRTLSCLARDQRSDQSGQSSRQQRSVPRRSWSSRTIRASRWASSSTCAPRGTACSLAHDGEEGLDKARETAIDLVILDVMLPRLNGFEVLRALPANGHDDARCSCCRRAAPRSTR